MIGYDVIISLVFPLKKITNVVNAVSYSRNIYPVEITKLSIRNNKYFIYARDLNGPDVVAVMVYGYRQDRVFKCNIFLLHCFRKR